MEAIVYMLIVLSKYIVMTCIINNTIYTFTACDNTIVNDILSYAMLNNKWHEIVFLTKCEF